MAPQEKDPTGEVLKETLRIGGRANAEEDCGDIGHDVLAQRANLKILSREAQDADDVRILAEQKLAAAESKTGRALGVFSKKVAGHYVTEKVKGDKSPEHVRLFDGKTASTLLPSDREARGIARATLTERVNAAETAREVKQHAQPLLTALAAEKTAAKEFTNAGSNYTAAHGREEKAKVATVVAVRAMAGQVQSKFAADPGRIREVLGYAAPGGAGRKKKGGEKTKADAGTGTGADVKVEQDK